MKVVIFAPFWRMPNHVGGLRVDRFRRWLAEDGYSVDIVSAGETDHVNVMDTGTEIVIRDALSLHARVPGSGNVRRRKPNRFRRRLAQWLFNPDPGILWAGRAAKNPLVRAAAQKAKFILSSSPPESAHIGAWKLSRATGTPHIVDMRDGWLDEPLKELLRGSGIRRWQEGRLEKRTLKNARQVQVTSDVWKELLCSRYPQLSPKVAVVTNGYPPIGIQAALKDENDGEVVLIHAGRFTGSRLTQLPHLLLEPLFNNISMSGRNGCIDFIGSLSSDEIHMIGEHKELFDSIGWRLRFPGEMPRSRVLDRMAEANGLLLLAASQASLPSKLFEYVATGLPIFAVTHKNSATWNLCSMLPQAALTDIASRKEQTDSPVEPPFFTARETDIPSEFSETWLRTHFLATIRGAFGD